MFEIIKNLIEVLFDFVFLRMIGYLMEFVILFGYNEVVFGFVLIEVLRDWMEICFFEVLFGCIDYHFGVKQ